MFLLRLRYARYALAGMMTGMLGSVALADWVEPTPAELEMAVPQIDPEAGAEYLSAHVEVDDSRDSGLTYRYDLRIKIFNEKGVEELGDVEIIYERGDRVSGLEARVIKTDGSFWELDKNEIYDREVARFGKARARMKSFSFRGLEPGDIIEYRYKVHHRRNWANGVTVYLDRDFPIHRSSAVLRPWPEFTSIVLARPVTNSLERVKARRWEVNLENVPASPDEFMSPPRRETSPWVMICYITQRERIKNLQDMWEIFGERYYDSNKRHVWSRSARVRKKAEELTAHLPPEEHLEALYNYCTEEIVNVYHYTSGWSAEEIEDRKRNKRPSDTIKRGYGVGWDINLLFAALAHASGFEAQVVRANNRNRVGFDIGLPPLVSLPDDLVAVRVDGEWQYFDPASGYYPFGYISWRNQGATVLFGNEDEIQSEVTPLADSGSNTTKRRADLAIDRFGNLTGRVVMQFTGQPAVSFKVQATEETLEELEEWMKSRYFPEFTNLQIRNLKPSDYEGTSPSPKVSFDIEIAGYGSAAGSRLFFAPSFFAQGETQRFTSETRLTPVRYRYREVIKDKVNIDFPEDYVLEEGRSPLPLVDNQFLKQEVTIGTFKGMNRIGFRRSVTCEILGVAPESYPLLRQMYADMRVIDEHMLGLRAAEALTSTTTP